MSTVLDGRQPVKGGLRARVPSPITIRLPELESVPEALRGKSWVVRELLANGDSNTKLMKSNAWSHVHGFRTFGLSLAPAGESGYEMCPQSTSGCRAVCLHHQGRAIVWPTIKASRIAKTIAFHEHRDWFEQRLKHELRSAVKASRQRDLVAAFRLNVLSDVAWEKVFPWLFSEHEDATWYDYVKVSKRAIKFAKGGGPSNYHLTFSRSESNELQCLQVLAAGGNVAVVFDHPPFPAQWHGYDVVNGDETDLRFLDPKNVVVGLKAKGSARRDDSGFVVHQLGLINRRS